MEDLESVNGHAEDILTGRRSVNQGYQSTSELIHPHGGQHSDSKASPANQLDEAEQPPLDLPQYNTEADARIGAYVGCNIPKIEELMLKESVHSINAHSGFHRHHISNGSDISEDLPQYGGESNVEKGVQILQPTLKTKESDTSLNAKRSVLDTGISTGAMEGYDATNHEGGKFFYFASPLYEETGNWIPVSVPPMTENDREEWTLGVCSNGGYIPNEDTGWSQYIGSDKELTMWDVVVEILLVARGKVTGLASGDVGRLSWISTNLMEQAWKEMAQTLKDANLSNIQVLLESEPPKWLADSTTSSCMLCNVRFHPIMCTRHHCRFCGGVFCGDCTKGRSLLPAKFRTGNPQRVCDVCCVRLESIQPYLMDQVSRAAQSPIHDVTDLSTLRSWVNFPWGQSMEYEIYKATNIIRSYAKVGPLKHEKRIPEAILQNAKGLAILTVVKVGMMVTYNVGTGLVVARRDDGSWSPPSAISSCGVGWGAQAGGEFIDFILVLRTNDALKTFCDAHFSVGAGFGAAVGPVGRTAEADVRAGTSGLAACYTYSCSRGAFIGCSLEGNFVTTRALENSRFYGCQSINAADILLGSLPPPPAATALYRALADLYLQLEK